MVRRFPPGLVFLVDNNEFLDEATPEREVAPLDVKTAKAGEGGDAPRAKPSDGDADR